MARPRLHPRRLAPILLATALAAIYLLWAPPSLDLAAAEYRGQLFGSHGLMVWDLQWYAGHHMPGYSVLAPPLAWWLGARLAGALAAVVAAVLFEQLVHTRYGERAWVGALWFGAGTATSLFTGRITFALGIVPALGALLALQRAELQRSTVAHVSGTEHPVDIDTSPPRYRADRPLWLALAIGLALVTPLASPVAALFLALAGTAYALGTRRAVGIALAAAALAPVALLALAFPEGGTEPFVLSAFWPVLAFAALALALLSREDRTLRAAVVLYALGCTAAYVLATPVGGNATRLGALCAGPIAALVWWRRRTLVLALMALPLLWWQWSAAIDDVHTASGDPTVHLAYHAPLLAFLERDARSGEPGRVEIPFTRLHWEARWIAPRFPLARGWERQLDRKVNPVFYDEDEPLTAARYRAWLDRMAVRWVALPDTRLDYSAQPEARLIEGGLPYLREVWHNADWRVFAVRDPAPLVDGPARVTELGADHLRLDAPRAGTLRLRVHWTPYWAVVAGDACVTPDGDWTALRVRRPGAVRLVLRFSPMRIGARSPRCDSLRLRASR